jgi:hypothetical protein
VDSLAFEEGDILLRRAIPLFQHDRRASRRERDVSFGVLVRNGGNWELIHSISGQISDEDGIRSEPLQSFVKNAKDNEVLHVKPAFVVNRQRITHESRVLLASNFLLTTVLIWIPRQALLHGACEEGVSGSWSTGCVYL